MSAPRQLATDGSEQTSADAERQRFVHVVTTALHALERYTGDGSTVTGRLFERVELLSIVYPDFEVRVPRGEIGAVYDGRGYLIEVTPL